MIKYTNTTVQREIVAGMRLLDPSLKQLKPSQVWALHLADEAEAQAEAEAAQQAYEDAALAAEDAAELAMEQQITVAAAPTEASAVVEYSADDYTAALDTASMVPQGLSKFDTDELTDAAAVIGRFTRDGEKLTEQRSALQLAEEYWERSGRISKARALDVVQQRFLDLAVDNELRIKYPVTMDIGTEPNKIAPQVIFIEMPRGSQANLRGEAVWAIAHYPEAQTFPDKVTGEIKTGPSKFIPACYTGVVATYRSYEAGRDAQAELAQAVSTFKQIRSKMLAAGGDMRYSDDPVRTSTIDDRPRLSQRTPQISVL